VSLNLSSNPRKPVSAQQLVLDLKHRPALDREDFLVTPSNSEAIDAVDAWPDWQHHGLALVGPAASGKTHLAHVWQAMSNAVVKSAADLTIEAVPGFLTSGAAIIEDLPGENLDEAALFHLLNLAREGRANVLLTSRDAPAHWPIVLADLASRLRALPVTRLDPPDDLLLRAVLVKLFSDRQLLVKDNVIDYLVKRMERSIETASSLVAKLDQTALSRKIKIGPRLAKEVIENLNNSSL